MGENQLVEEVVSIISDSDSETCSDRPLIDLFTRLISSENEKHTLKNTQIYDILQKEFNVDLKELHVLEIDIYLTVIKKFLKDWPEWDRFDKIINERRKQGDDLIDDTVLEKNYQSAKSFLKKALENVKPLAKAAVKTLVEKTQGPKEEEHKEDDPILEVTATRAQLKGLFYRHPNRKGKNEVFNTVTSVPSQIKLSTPNLRSILNWWDINITITTSTDIVLYKRETSHEFKYVLLNKRLNRRKRPPKELNQALQYKGGTDKKVNINDLISFINTSFAPYSLGEIPEILNFVKTDLKLLPSTVFQEATYRRHTNKYPYVRYLYKDVENVNIEDTRTYDLQLEETISPTYEIMLGNFASVLNKNHVMSDKSVTIQCIACSVTFQGQDIISTLKTHFDMQHNNESDLICTNCKEKFSVEFLAENWWYHKCNAKNED